MLEKHERSEPETNGVGLWAIRNDHHNGQEALRLIESIKGHVGRGS